MGTGMLYLSIKEADWYSCSRIVLKVKCINYLLLVELYLR
jgi:hypothetical protein